MLNSGAPRQPQPWPGRRMSRLLPILEICCFTVSVAPRPRVTMVIDGGHADDDPDHGEKRARQIPADFADGDEQGVEKSWRSWREIV